MLHIVRDRRIRYVVFNMIQYIIVMSFELIAFCGCNNIVKSGYFFTDSKADQPSTHILPD